MDHFRPKVLTVTVHANWFIMSDEVTGSLRALPTADHQWWRLAIFVPTVQDWNDKLQVGHRRFVADLCFSGAFAKVRKATVSLPMSVCSHRTDFHEIWYSSIFRKAVEEKFQQNLTRITGYEDQYTFWSYVAQCLLERCMFQTRVVEKIQTPPKWKWCYLTQRMNAQFST